MNRNGVGGAQGMDSSGASGGTGMGASSNVEAAPSEQAVGEQLDIVDSFAGAGASLSERGEVPHDASEPEALALAESASAFAQRFLSTVVDLFAEGGEHLDLPEPIPGSGELLYREMRHLWAAAKGAGKTFAALVTSVQMAVEGVRVLILDVENGSQIYAPRLRFILDQLGLDGEAREAVRRNLVYASMPRLRMVDAEEFVEVCRGFDVVVFDSQRRFLTDLDLDENESDDCSKFVRTFIDPLKIMGIATLLLDNTGHENSKRSRGSSAKGDLADIVGSFTTRPFSQERPGTVTVDVPPNWTRIGIEGAWTMVIGGGRLEPFRRLEQRQEGSFQGDHVSRGEGLMVLASDPRAHESQAAYKGMSKARFESAFSSAGYGGRMRARATFEALVEEAHAVEDGAQGQDYESALRVTESGATKYLRLQAAPTGTLLAGSPASYGAGEPASEPADLGEPSAPAPKKSDP